MAEFDIQQFLSEMRQEQNDNNRRIEDKCDSILMTVADHETRLALIEVVPIAEHEVRLSKVESVVKILKYVVVTVFGSGLTGLIGMFIGRFSGGK